MVPRCHWTADQSYFKKLLYAKNRVFSFFDDYLWKVCTLQKQSNLIINKKNR